MVCVLCVCVSTVCLCVCVSVRVSECQSAECRVQRSPSPLACLLSGWLAGTVAAPDPRVGRAGAEGGDLLPGPCVPPYCFFIWIDTVYIRTLGCDKVLDFYEILRDSVLYECD